MCPRHDLSLCACTTAGLTSELLVSMGPSPLQWFLHAKSVISLRITSLYGSQPSCLVFGCKAANFWPEWQFSIDPSHNLWFYACKTAWLAPELQVSMGLSPRLCSLHAKQRLWTRITSFYGSQTSPVLLCMQNSVICTKMTSSHGFQPSSVVLCMQNSDFRTSITSLCRWIDPTCGFCIQNSDFWTRITSLYGSQTSPVIFCKQKSVPSIRITSLHGSQPSSVVFACKSATFGSE